MAAPRVVVIAGPNGAGKSTTAPTVLRDLGIGTFVNADTIARGLSEFHPEDVAAAAGRIMVARLQELAAEKQDFAFETTLASRSFARWLSELRHSGYETHLVYLTLPSADAAVERVRGRVAHGGHSVPEETIRRRFVRSLKNLFDLYLPVLDRWRIVDNSAGTGIRLIAQQEGSLLEVMDQITWERLKANAHV
jgi:predicted ABC-type ATPase